MGQVGDAVQLNCITYMFELANFYIICKCWYTHSINSTVFYLYNRSMTMCLILSLMKGTPQWEHSNCRTTKQVILLPWKPLKYSTCCLSFHLSPHSRSLHCCWRVLNNQQSTTSLVPGWGRNQWMAITSKTPIKSTPQIYLKCCLFHYKLYT